MENVDIVNEKDEVINTVTKQKAHDDGLLHRTVIAEMIDDQGDWILVRQSADRQDSGQFVSPCGGHVEAGESEDEALKREVLEELGVRDFRYHLVGKVIYNRVVLGRKENHYFIVYQIQSENKITLNHESVEYKRFTERELSQSLKESKEDFGPPFHFIIKTFYPNLLK